MAESWDDAAPAVRRTVVDPRTGAPRSLPLDVGKIVTALESLIEQIEVAADELAIGDYEATSLKVAYETSYARAVVDPNLGGRNKEEREARALLEVHDVFERWMLAEQKVRALKEATYSVKNRLSAYQSIGALVRNAVDF